MKNVEKDIRPILEQNEEARADDMKLYFWYVRGKGGEFNRCLLDRIYRISNGLVSYDRVSRARRKLQEHYADLRPTEEYMEKRKQAEKEFRAYAKGVKA